MKRLFAAGLLALSALWVAPAAQAQAPGCPTAGFGPGQPPSCLGGCAHLGCGGFCFKHFGALHQHGPLFNYGPYYGYYPFEPYGPWNANLQYTGPRGPLTPDCGGCGHCAKCAHLFGRLNAKAGCDSCGGWGGYSKATFRNVFHRVFPLAHKGGCPGGCSSAVAALPSATGIVSVGATTDTAGPDGIVTRRER